MKSKLGHASHKHTERSSPAALPRVVHADKAVNVNIVVLM